MLRELAKNHPTLKRLALVVQRFLAPFSMTGGFAALLALPRFFGDWASFRRAGGKASLLDAWPCLLDRTATTSVDSHYFNQAVWAGRHIRESGSADHVDIGSDVNFVGMLTVFTRVTFIDIRPLELTIANYRGMAGSITALPLPDASVRSLSCLHVIEHIGLGRYGDPVDPEGSRKAAAEIVRVLAPGGKAYVSAPIGRSRVQFNGQRVFAIPELTGLFAPLVPAEFSMVTAGGEFIERADLATADIAEAGAGLDSGLGLFLFTKPAA